MSSFGILLRRPGILCCHGGGVRCLLRGLKAPSTSVQRYMASAQKKQMSNMNDLNGHTNGVNGVNGLIRPELHTYSGADNLAFNERVQALIQSGEEVYHFGFGQSPFPVCEPMVESLTQHCGQMAYLPVQGMKDLRTAICGLHQRYDQLAVQPEQVVVGPGTKQLIYLLMHGFNGEILLVSPSWTTYKPQCQLSGHSPYIVTTSLEEGWKITPQHIDKTIREGGIENKNKLLVLCNPDNPTGVCYNEQDLKELADYCREKKIVVLTDEIYARLHYRQQHKTLATYYPEGTIISSGFSKWASAGGWRLGYQIYPAELEELKQFVISASSHTHSCAPAPMQYAVSQALLERSGDCEKYMKHTARIMQAVADFCYRELTSVGVTAVPSEAGYYFMPDFSLCRAGFSRRGIHTGQQMCDAMLKECKVALMPGGPAFLRPLDELTVRFCYVNFDGTEGLAESYRLGLNHQLDDGFVQKYAPNTYKGVKALKSWVEKHKV